MTVEAVQGNQVHLEWTETFGGLLEWWHDPWSRLSCEERLLLRCDGNAGNPFPMKQGKEIQSHQKSISPDIACRKSVESNSGAFHLDLVAAYV